ncbi:MAG: EamA family transporter, partial [Oscillospiraceae bacterium]|nr:EamA family transporter [Oscillospiraceae bacterium]
MSKQTAIMIMLLVTVIWGGGFPATGLALQFGVTVGIINMVRGAIFTVLVFAVFHRQILTMKKKDIKIGLFAGTANVLAFLLQTIGTQYTTLSNTAFLTTTNVIMIPFMVWVLMKKRPVAKNFVAMGICMVGTA